MGVSGEILSTASERVVQPPVCRMPWSMSSRDNLLKYEKTVSVLRGKCSCLRFYRSGVESGSFKRISRALGRRVPPSLPFDLTPGACFCVLITRASRGVGRQCRVQSHESGLEASLHGRR